MKKQLLLLVVILLPMVTRAASVEIDGIYYELVSKAKQATVKGAVLTSGNLIIPASVTYEGVEYSVTSIGSEAFKGRSMTSVTIPNSVSSIGENAFQSCSGLTSVHISDIAAWCRISFGSGYANPLHCAHHLYLGDEEIKDLVIPNSVTCIERCAFWGCSGLTSITIPGSVTSIRDHAFQYCSGLTAVHISDIGAWCKISFIQSSNPLILAHHLFLNGEEVKDLAIPNSVTSIEGSAFYGCIGLTSVTIGNSVTSIGNAAFYGCTDLTSASIGNGVTSIGHSAFSGCSGLTSVTLGSSVTNIDNNAFSGCSGLTSVTLPNSVTNIGCEAFYGCSGLTSVTIPNSVTLIRDYTFGWCNDLTSVTIGSGVNTIGTQAFTNCPELTDVYCYAENVPNMRLTDYLSISYTDAFYGSYIEYATLHVPTTSIDAYKAKEPWKNFKEIVPIEGTDPNPDPEPTDDDKIVVAGFSATKGQQATFSINLENKDTDLTAYQFDLTLPDGISLSVNDKGKYVVTKTNRYEDDNQKLDISKMEGNTYRFVCSSMSSEKITGTSGAILNAALTIGASVNDGNYEAAIANIIVTKVNGTQLKLKDAKFNIVVTNIIKGDANGDGEVNVSDIVEIIDYIMNKPSDKFVYAAADLNEDGEVNVTDIVKVVNIIMSFGSNALKRASVAEMADDDQLTLVESDKSLTLCLDNESQYVASQFEIRLGDGQTLESISLNNKRSGGHLMSYAKTGDNLYKVVVYSTDNRPFNGNSGELLSFKVSGTGNVEVSNILFVTSRETEKLFPALVAGTTSIDVIKTSEAMDIYSVDGRLLQKQATNTNGLKKGLYIISGKKMVVK